MSPFFLLLCGFAGGIILIFAIAVAVSLGVASRNKKSFSLEYEAKNIDRDNNASARSLSELLAKCPKNATVVFAVGTGGAMRIRLDNSIDYDAGLNEVVLFPFDMPDEDGNYTDMLRRRMKKKAKAGEDESTEDEELSTEKK